MKRIFLLIIMALASLGTQAQNEKNLVVDANAEVRNVSGFTGIEVSGAIDLYISQGTTEAVAVSGNSDEIKSRIKTEIRSGILLIYFDGKGLNWKIWGNNKMKAYVTYKTLERLEASGACNVKATDPIKQQELRMEMSGASDFSGEIAVTKFRLSASGASNVKVSGRAADAVLNASGACNIKAYDLVTDMCKIDASGASNARITVNKELNAIASGGSTIFYKGTGLIRDISSSGGASIKRRSDD
ncbi:MAG: head GIN domain-containing protein [Bacteroidota bacterium]